MMITGLEHLVLDRFNAQRNHKEVKLQLIRRLFF